MNPVLTEFKLKDKRVKNRVVMTPYKIGFSELDGKITDKYIAFYKRRAESAGIIITEPMFVHKSGKEIPRQNGIDSDDKIEKLKKLTEEVHKYNTLIIAHLNHAGRVANPKIVGDTLYSASDVKCPSIPAKNIHSLTIEEIKDFQKFYIDGARRAVEAGFDGVEIQFGHGYLIHQFLSRKTNKREDEYGGSIYNRIKFGMEIINDIRNKYPDIILSVRVNTQDKFPEGLTVDDAIFISNQLKKAGVDIISFTMGSMCENPALTLFAHNSAPGELLPYVSQIKDNVNITSIVTGRMNNINTFSYAIESGITEFVGFGRQFIIDPDFVVKLRDNKERLIAYCAACHQGCLGKLREGVGSRCIINPETGREDEIQYKRISEKKRVLILGSGPAGLESAMRFAKSNFEVFLWESDSKIGGQLNIAGKPPYKKHFIDFIDYYKNNLEELDVNIDINKRYSIEDIKILNPDYIVVATGSNSFVPPIKGLDKINYLTGRKVLSGENFSEEKVVVIGGGLVGLETALYLAEQGKKVTILEMLDKVGTGLDILPLKVLLSHLANFNVEIKTEFKVVEVENNKLTGETKEGVQSLDFDKLVIAVGAVSNNDIYNSLLLEFGEKRVKLIGDALKPRRIIDATEDALRIVNEIIEDING